MTLERNSDDLSHLNDDASGRGVAAQHPPAALGAPELVSALDRGEVSVSAAAEIAKRPKEEQAPAVAQRRESRPERPRPAGFDVEREIAALAEAAEALVAKCRKHGTGTRRLRDVLSDRIARWASEEAS